MSFIKEKKKNPIHTALFYIRLHPHKMQKHAVKHWHRHDPEAEACWPIRSLKKLAAYLLWQDNNNNNNNNKTRAVMHSDA